MRAAARAIAVVIVIAKLDPICPIRRKMSRLRYAGDSEYPDGEVMASDGSLSSGGGNSDSQTAISLPIVEIRRSLRDDEWETIVGIRVDLGSGTATTILCPPGGHARASWSRTFRVNSGR